jgi:hypothetical protein
MATFPSKVNYVTGDILTATNMNDVGGAINLLESSQSAAGKNFAINGGFDIWSRGTSGFGTNQTYNADRWFSAYNAGTVTISQQTTGIPAGSTYCWRATNGAAASLSQQRQFLESFTANILKGKTVTFSVKLRRNATMASSIQVSVYKNATANTSTAGTWSQIGVTTVANASLPTGTTASDWYSASVTVAIPNDGTANGIAVAVEPTATDASGAYWEMAQAQLEIASTVSIFQRAGGTIQGELAACQRYYYRAGGSTAYQYFTNAAFLTTTTTRGVLPFPVTMRTAPTFGSSNANTFYVLSSGNTAGDSGTAIGTDNLSNTGVALNMTVGTARTAGIAATILAANNVNTYLEFIAEL